MAKTLRRPKKEMMLAVNASIDGDTKTLAQLRKDFDIGNAELKTRLEMRNGEKYGMTRKGGRKKGTGKKKPTNGRRRGPGRPPKAAAVEAPKRDLLDMIDGRTKTVSLLKLSHKIEDILGQRDKKEVEKIDKALIEYEEMEGKLEAMKQLIDG